VISIYAYCALGIDFEGSIGFDRQVSKATGLWKFQPNVRVSNTSKELLFAFTDQVGFGKVSLERSKTDKATLYEWRMSIDEIREHLESISEHLILKYEQARLLMTGMRIQKPRSETSRLSTSDRVQAYSVDEYTELVSIFHQIQKLNVKPVHRMTPLTDAEKLLREFRKR
jgi:hypothetical protein